jgi:hypothetical protein
MNQPSRPAPLNDDAVLAAVAAGRVTGQASAWWLDGWRCVTAAVRRLQRRGLVADATPPRCGRITAELVDTGRDNAAEKGPTP